MGLGKTVQTIAFLCWLKQQHRAKKENESSGAAGAAALPHLIIAPASVLSNWEREFQNFAPHLNVVKYHGTMAERLELQDTLRIHLPGKELALHRSQIEPLDVILSPVTYFQQEKSDDRSFLRTFRYDYLVVDEAHLLKNARGSRYKNLDRFSTKHRLLLTGTPVQNSPKELLSLLCFLMPLFSRKTSGSFDADGRVNDGGESMLAHFVSLEGSGTDETAYEKLKQLFAPFVLRRTKADVLHQVLPAKLHKVDFVQLNPTSRKLYDSLLSEHVRAKKAGSAAAKDHLFTQLRKASHHPLLLRSRYVSLEEKEHLRDCFYRYGAFSGQGCTKAKVAGELDKFNDFHIHLTALELVEANPCRRQDLERYILTEDDLFSSSKCVRLQQLLPELIAGGHRILIFSVWTSCLDLLTCLLESMSIEYMRMEGSTPVGERQDLIDKFNRSPSIPIFLLSTKACGLGINLTSADTCIFHDLDFNPMNDAQAEGMCVFFVGLFVCVSVHEMLFRACE
jgi:SWI/SNF-related matrix-associated actin-dependent regulator of chromatin subfamily A containing DEAD/H box 1